MDNIEHDIVSDDQLARQLHKGSKMAFHQVYERYWKRLYNYTYGILGDTPITEDCIQDVFTGLWLKRDKNLIQNVKAYLFNSCRNAAISKIRQARFTNLHEEIISNLILNPEVESKLDLEDLEAEIEEASRGLPKRCKEIFYMSRFENLNIEEIAVQLNVSKRTVENQLSIALKHIRSQLKPTIILLMVLSSVT